MKFLPVILLRKRVFHFGIALSGVKQCDYKQMLKTFALSSHCSTPESAIKKWKTLFLSKITEAA